MPKLFESMLMDGEDMRAKIVPHGWRVIVSINGVAAERIKALAKELSPKNWKSELNSLLPVLMSMTDAPLGEEVTVVVKGAGGSERTIKILYHEVDKMIAKHALSKNFKAIFELAKAAGLTEKEIRVVFASSLKEYERMSSIDGIDAGGLWESVAEKMMGSGAGGGNGNDCKAQ